MQRGPAKPHKPGGFPANNGVRTQQHTLKGSLLSNPRNIETTEEVINMANLQDAINAAKKLPSDRSPEDNRLIAHNRGDVRVRNADHDAQREERIG